MDAQKLNRTIFIRDNLDVLRTLKDQSVDLIYLDPPFNSNKNYGTPIGSKVAGFHFKDMWTLSDTDEAWWGQLSEEHPNLYEIIHAVGCVNGNKDKSYLIYMAMKLLEMKNILKDTESIYLHCDKTMSHPLKLIMDAIFGKENFKNEISWKRYAVHSLKGDSFDNITDCILFYSRKTSECNFQQIFIKDKENSKKLLKKFKYIETETGRRFHHGSLEKSSNASSKNEIRIINGKKVKTNLGWVWSQKTFDKRINKNKHLD